MCRELRQINEIPEVIRSLIGPIFRVKVYLRYAVLVNRRLWAIVSCKLKENNSWALNYLLDGLFKHDEA